MFLLGGGEGMDTDRMMTGKLTNYYKILDLSLPRPPGYFLWGKKRRNWQIVKVLIFIHNIWGKPQEIG